MRQVYKMDLSLISNLLPSFADFLLRSFGRIQVELQIRYRKALFISGPDSEFVPILEINITNKGREPRFLERPLLEFDPPTDRGSVITPFEFGDLTQYPIEVRPGQRHTATFSVPELNNNISEADIDGVVRFRGLTKDTFGRWHKSKWKPMKELLNT